MKPIIHLLENEKILFEAQPRRALAAYLLLRKGIHFLLVLMVFFVVFFVESSKNHSLGYFLSSSVFFYGLAFIAIPFIIAYLWLRAAISRHYFIFTDQRCILYSGFVGINKRLISYQKMVDVDFSQGPLESLFRIASVNIAEQSSNNLAGSISQSSRDWNSFFNLNPSAVLGLSYDDADKLTHLISEHITKKS